MTFFQVDTLVVSICRANGYFQLVKRDTSARQGWIYGEGSRQDLHDESNAIEMTASVVPAGGLVVFAALVGLGIFGVAASMWRPLLEASK